MQFPLNMPGATSMTRLKVYDTVTPDGQIGGTPHMHLICTEMYVVLSGSGAVELLDKDGFSRVPLTTGDALLFSPGTIHRLINPNGDLTILVIMQNSGLPERGDNVVTFEEEWLATDETYTQAMSVSSVEDAYQRRNRGVEGFLELRTAFEANLGAGRAALRKFYEYACKRTATKHQQWQEIIAVGAQQATEGSLTQVHHLQQGKTDYLFHNGHALSQPTSQSTLGFCGHLNRYFDAVSLQLDGIADE